MPLWAAHCFRRIRVPNKEVALQHARRCGLCVAFVAYATPWPQMQSDADRCYIAVIQLPRRVSPAAGCRASFCWRNPPCRWTQPCQVVEFNYQFMSKVCYIFNMNWEWSSSTAADAGWDIRLDGNGEIVSPNRAHPRFSCFQCWPQLEPSLEARESVDVLCCATPDLVWDFNYVALLVELDYQMMLKPQTFNIIW